MTSDLLPCSASSIARRRSLTRVAYFADTLPGDLVERLWSDPVFLMSTGDTLQRTGLRRTMRIVWGSKQYVMKHYQPTWWHKVKQLVQQSRAWSTWSATHKLADAGITTPRPVACVENRWGPLRRDSFLMYPFVEGRTLRSCFKHEAKKSRPLADNLWRQLRELFHRLEQLRASLADTNTGNFIVSADGRIWVIDLDKACFHRLASRAARCQERGWKQLLRSAAKCNTAAPVEAPPARPLAA